MYRDMGSAALPGLTKHLLRGGVALRLGVPFALLLAFVASFVRRAPVGVRIGLAALIAIVAGVWLYALYEPIFALAGNISE